MASQPSQASIYISFLKITIEVEALVLTIVLKLWVTFNNNEVIHYY